MTRVGMVELLATCKGSESDLGSAQNLTDVFGKGLCSVSVTD